jgi:hypothetical protein
MDPSFIFVRIMVIFTMRHLASSLQSLQSFVEAVFNATRTTTHFLVLPSSLCLESPGTDFQMQEGMEGWSMLPQIPMICPYCTIMNKDSTSTSMVSIWHGAGSQM